MQQTLVSFPAIRKGQDANLQVSLRVWIYEQQLLSIYTETIRQQFCYCGESFFSERAFSTLLRISQFIELLMPNLSFFASVIMLSRTLKSTSNSCSKSSRRIVLRTKSGKWWHRRALLTAFADKRRGTCHIYHTLHASCNPCTSNQLAA